MPNSTQADTRAHLRIRESTKPHLRTDCLFISKGRKIILTAKVSWEQSERVNRCVKLCEERGRLRIVFPKRKRSSLLRRQTWIPLAGCSIMGECYWKRNVWALVRGIKMLSCCLVLGLNRLRSPKVLNIHVDQSFLAYK